MSQPFLKDSVLVNFSGRELVVVVTTASTNATATTLILKSIPRRRNNGDFIWSSCLQEWLSQVSCHLRSNGNVTRCTWPQQCVIKHDILYMALYIDLL